MKYRLSEEIPLREGANAIYVEPRFIALSAFPIFAPIIGV
jgi:hypothetical protein